MDMKRCKQCGVLKSVDAFRPYTYSRKQSTEGRFRICRQCENINTAYRRLVAERQKFWNADEARYGVPAAQMPYYNNLVAEIEKVEELYRLLEAHGCSTPLSSKAEHSTSIMPSVIGSYITELNAFYSAPESTHKTIAPQPEEIELPNDLQRWLAMTTQDLVMAGLTPDYLQETVYESLRAKYRPQIGTDPNTFLPIYDDTYKVTLNKILRLFDDYEDYWAQEQEETNGTD